MITKANKSNDIELWDRITTSNDDIKSEAKKNDIKLGNKMTANDYGK